jgi:signal peptidase I
MNWTLLAFAALVAGPLLIAYARRKTTEPVFEADQLSETAMWGYFLLLVGAWGVLSIFANPSDLFFVIMMVPTVLVVIARLRGHRARGNSRPLPDWAAFGYANWLILGAIGIGKTFVVEPMQIPSSSMRPGLVVGDFILINKFAYGVRVPFLNQTVVPVGHPQHGDVVVFRFPLDEKTNFIKRVIGVPGDRVEYRNKLLTVNGKLLEVKTLGEYTYSDHGEETTVAARLSEQYESKKYEILNVAGVPTLLPAGVVDFPGRENCQYDDTGFACTVPEGKYLMLGDNRDNSRDSRYWGFVSENQLSGRAFMIWMNLGDLSRIGTRIR